MTPRPAPELHHYGAQPEEECQQQKGSGRQISSRAHAAKESAQANGRHFDQERNGQMPKHPELPGMPPSKPPTRLDDLQGLFPPNVMPTGQLYVLEQGDSYLFLKTYEWFRNPTPKQREIWMGLARFGELPDAKGSISVLCIWGLGHKTKRRAVMFDYRGEVVTEVYDVESLRALVKGWFWDNGRRR